MYAIELAICYASQYSVLLLPLSRNVSPSQNFIFLVTIIYTVYM